MAYGIDLPDKPSELLKVALEDLQKCERDYRYRIRMIVWHHPLEDGTCLICMAGAVMAQRSDCGPMHDVEPADFNPETRNKLMAIDAFRLGECANAFAWMGLSSDDGIDFNRSIIQYATGPVSFKADISQLIKDLKAAGF